jgi:hypothetical protein
MDLLLEEEFLDVLAALARSLPWHDIWQQPLPGAARARGSPAGAQQQQPAAPPEAPPSAEEQSQQELQVRHAAANSQQVCCLCTHARACCIGAITWCGYCCGIVVTQMDAPRRDHEPVVAMPRSYPDHHACSRHKVLQHRRTIPAVSALALHRRWLHQEVRISLSW